MEQDSVNIYDDLLSGNCLIDLHSQIVTWPRFLNSDLKTDKNIQKVEVKVKADGIMIISKAPDIFQDTFLMKCFDSECCIISMKSQSLYIELIYNGNYNGIGRSKNCPRADKILDNLEL